MRSLPMLPVNSSEGLPVMRPRKLNITGRTMHATMSMFALIGDSLGGAVDGMVSVVSPALALQRKYARDAYRSVRSYDAAKINRLNLSRVVVGNRDADAEINGKQNRIRSFAREEVRNNAVARNLKQTHANNAVGDADIGQGITIDPAVLLPDGTPDKKTNGILKTAWEKYRDLLEYTGRWGFADSLVINDHELCEAGEVLGILHDKPAPGSDLPFSFELLEADRLPINSDMHLPTNSTGEFILTEPVSGMPVINPTTQKPMKHVVKHGIEYDENKQITAFHILKDHPGSEYLLGTTFKTDRVLKDRVIHYFRPDRAEQTRGVSWFVAALGLLADLRDLLSWELIAAKAQACFGIHFSGSGTPNMTYPSGQVTNPPQDMNGNVITQMQPGMATVGAHKAEFYGGNRPGGTFLPFFQSIIRLCGAAFGMGYSASSRDISQGSFSGLKHEDNEDERSYRTAQGLHARHFCKRVWRGFVKACAIKGIIDAREYRKNPSRFERCSVKVPGRKHINPLQEVTADAVAVKNGFKELNEVVINGQEPEDILKKLGEQKKMAEENDLELGVFTGVIKPPVNQPITNKDPGEDGSVSAEQLESVGVKSASMGDANDE